MIYNNILRCISEGKKSLAVLIDPDKIKHDGLSDFMQKLNHEKLGVDKNKLEFSKQILQEFINNEYSNVSKEKYIEIKEKNK